MQAVESNNFERVEKKWRAKNERQLGSQKTSPEGAEVGEWDEIRKGLGVIRRRREKGLLEHRRLFSLDCYRIEMETVFVVGATHQERNFFTSSSFLLIANLSSR